MALHTWLSSSNVRHFPRTPIPPARPLALEGALNEPVHFQAGLRGDDPRQNIRIDVQAPAGWSVRVRREGYVPVAHHNLPVSDSDLDVDGRDAIPGYVADPLFDEDAVLLPPDETHAFWISAQPGRGATPGRHRLTVRLIPDKGRPQTHTAAIRLHPLELKPRKNFHVTNWFYADSLLDWYKTDGFDARFWELLAAYLRDMASHGQDTVYVPVFTPPLDGVKRPTQLLRVERAGPRRWRFDWRDVRRYVRLARSCGITHFEWCHPFTQWGVQHAIRIYEGQGRDEKRLWPPATPATSPVYRAFLAQYLPELRRFLDQERILDHSFFHVSDEPHGEKHLENYRKARALLRELAPWMTVMDALSDIVFGRNHLTDMPIPSVSTALDFLREGIPCWCYYCCGPRGGYIQRLLDTPLPKVAMHGFLFYRWPFQGFLHWGYNYWYQSQTRTLIDPYTVQDGCRWDRGWAYGDTFMVYPGSNGPVDSIRWEVFAEALRDYRLLQTLGVPRGDPLLKPIKTLEDFPKTEAWRRRARAALFARHARSAPGLQ
jgi:hypothetical protein